VGVVLSHARVAAHAGGGNHMNNREQDSYVSHSQIICVVK